MEMLEMQLATLQRCAVDVGADGPFLALHANLTKADIDFSQNTTLADLTPIVADFDGYAAKAITFGTPTIADDGTVEVLGTVPMWTPSGSSTPNAIYCLWINVSGEEPLFIGRFDGAPLPMEGTTSQILIVVRYRPATQTIVVTIS